MVWPNVAEGFVGYAPGPKVLFRVTPFTRFNILNPSTIPSRRTLSVSLKVRLSRAFRLTKSKPFPALRLIIAPFMVGRALVPWIVADPVVILNGKAE